MCLITDSKAFLSLCLTAYPWEGVLSKVSQNALSMN